MAESLGAVSERWGVVLIVVERDGTLVLVVEPTRVAVPCPLCGELRSRQHSRYERHPLDLPWRGQTVHLRVHSRRWFCDVPTCPRRSSPNASTARWPDTHTAPPSPMIC
jgi:transposase